MKRILALSIITSLFLTACGGSGLTSEQQDLLSDYPELEGPMLAWNALAEAGESEDCEGLIDGMRLSLQLDEETCPAAFEFFADGAPEIDWERTEWSSTGGKAKIYEMDKGDLTSFILNEATDEWRADTVFWE